MDTNVQALKNLYEQLGGDPADVADISTNADMINAIAGLDIGGGGGTVDQTYNSASTNAQSGTAVAEAIADEIAKGTITGVSGISVQNYAVAQQGGIVALSFRFTVDDSAGFTINNASPGTKIATISEVSTNYTGVKPYAAISLISNADFTDAGTLIMSVEPNRDIYVRRVGGNGTLSQYTMGYASIVYSVN